MIGAVVVEYVGGPLDGERRILPEVSDEYLVQATTFLSRAALDRGEYLSVTGRYRRRTARGAEPGGRGMDAVYDWDCWMVDDDVVRKRWPE